MAWKDVGSFFSQMGSGFLAGRNPAWGEQQLRRQQMSDLLRERLFNENIATQKMGLEQKEATSNDTYRKYQMGQHPDGSPMSEEELAQHTSRGARSATPNRTGGAGGTDNANISPNELTGEKQVEGINSGALAPAELTSQPIDVTRGGQTTSLPWEQFDTKGGPSFPSAGGGAPLIPTGPAAFQQTKAQGELTTETAKKNADFASKQQAWQTVAGDPAMEELRMKNPSAYNDYALEAQLGIKTQKPESQDAVRAMAMNEWLKAQASGDETGKKRWEDFHDKWFPNAGGAGLPQNPADISAMAKGIGNYQLSPLNGFVLRSNQGQAIMAQVLRENPDYQATNYNAFNTMERNATSGKLGDSSNALNVMLGHTQELIRAGQALKNNDLQSINSIANKLGAQTGSSAPTVFNSIVNRLGPEVSRAYIGAGAGTLEDRKGNKIDFDVALSPKQLLDNAVETVRLGVSKIKANQDQYNRGTYGRGKQKFLTDENEQFIRSLGIDPEKPLTDRTGASTTPPPPGTGVVSATPPPGIPAPPAVPRPERPGQKLDRATGLVFYNLFGKDPAKAEAAARTAGWDPSK